MDELVVTLVRFVEFHRLSRVHPILVDQIDVGRQDLIGMVHENDNLFLS